jgi:hypothetical protein
MALCGIITAFSFVMMGIAGIFHLSMYFSPMISGAVISIIVKEINAKWGFTVFLAVSILSVLFVANKETVLFFILIFGHYPIFKIQIDRLKNKILILVIKMIIFNLSAAIGFFIAIKVIGLPKAMFELFGVYMPFLLLVLGNIVFFIYDRALSNLVKVYDYHFHDRVKKLLHL